MEKPDSRLTNSRMPPMVITFGLLRSKTGCSNLRFFRCSCTALWISGGTDDGPQSHSYVWIENERSMKKCVSVTQEMSDVYSKHRKALTSQLQAISPDAKVIDARKLLSPMLQLASSIWLPLGVGRIYGAIVAASCFFI